ncbi:methyltransferase domain-containing protein [Streptomyces harbinensis]|uniref:Protein-L-isoaspartate O-methyltransferase n=1 Tax=Streptomyces harbinensis TaxID=1176198 RepID=A0A1I6P3J6_9ACTN|nr:methyltransferase domain-containing protein [Streptomyces harbinensis]SFS34660.1 protein-L-isoaspartate(D-aspartate) O-methyltransferase [Streptomyces harbinensis]
MIAATHLDTLRGRLTESLAEAGHFREEWLRLAFGRIPREKFAPETVWRWSEGGWRALNRREDPGGWAELVYHPTGALVTQIDDGSPAADGAGIGATSSMSSAEVVLSMLSVLDLRPGHSVLEIGSGTGYNAALLCERLGAERVVTVEIDPLLAELATQRLASAGHRPLVVCGDGEAGYPDRAPYDRLIATASVRRVPPAWLRQVRPGGVMVIPWYPNPAGFGLIRLRMSEDGTARGRFQGRASFMPVRGQRTVNPRVTALWDATWDEADRIDGDAGLLELGRADARFALGVRLPGFSAQVRGDGLLLLSDDDESWLWIKRDATYRHGPRDLVAEAGRFLGWWRAEGSPGAEEFGITVTGEEQLVWLRDEQRVLQRTALR